MSPASQSGASLPPSGNPQRIPPWLVRTELFLRVLLRIYIGLFVFIAPWAPIFWDQNLLIVRLIAHFPALAAVAQNGAVRGLISGLGLLNLWIAFQDALRYRNR